MRLYCPRCAVAPRRHAWLVLGLALAGCGEVWNDPYPAADRGKNILYWRSSSGRSTSIRCSPTPRTSATFTQQIYEPPLQYHYLKRPYELIPLTAASTQCPKPTGCVDAAATFTRVRDPHPARHPLPAASGVRRRTEPLYLVSREEIKRSMTLPYDLPTGTRELIADDYIYQIKRLAHPRLHSPIFGLMSEYIVGLKEYRRERAARSTKRSRQGRMARPARSYRAGGRRASSTRTPTA